MKKVIHHIRSKSNHEKDRIIWMSALVGIAILLIIWAIVGNGRKTTPDENFFQIFGQDLEDGRDVLPQDPLAP